MTNGRPCRSFGNPDPRLFERKPAPAPTPAPPLPYLGWQAATVCPAK